MFVVAPGAGGKLREMLHFSSAVRIGDRVETSGHGGWNEELEIPTDIEAEIRSGFRNIEIVLKEAGASWDHVVHVNTYHVGGFPPDRQRHDRKALPPVHAASCTDLDTSGRRKSRPASNAVRDSRNRNHSLIMFDLEPVETEDARDGLRHHVITLKVVSSSQRVGPAKHLGPRFKQHDRYLKENPR